MRRALISLVIGLVSTPAAALVDARGRLIDSPRNLEIAKCERLAQQAVRSGIRKQLHLLHSNVKKFSAAELRAGCEMTELHNEW